MTGFAAGLFHHRPVRTLPREADDGVETTPQRATSSDLFVNYLITPQTKRAPPPPSGAG